MAINATVASALADSYLTVAAADALAAADLGPEVTAWTAAVTDTKERALKRATREIDSHLRSGWLRYSATQALLFPRSIDYSGTPAVAEIPLAVLLATYEQATYVNKNAAVIDAAATRRAREMQSASEPNVSYTVHEEAPVLSPAALEYLADLPHAGSDRGLHSVRVSAGYVG